MSKTVEKRTRPYLGIKTDENGKNIVVFFAENEEDYGMVVLSEREDTPIGLVRGFNESEFEYLDSDQQIRLSNDDVTVEV